MFAAGEEGVWIFNVPMTFSFALFFSSSFHCRQITEMFSITDISQTAFWEKLTNLNQDLLLTKRSMEVLASSRGGQKRSGIRAPDNNSKLNHIIEMIEDLILEFLTDLNDKTFPCFTLNKRGCSSNTIYTEGVGLEMVNDVSFHEISLENRNSLYRFGVFINCLSHSYSMLQNKKFSTKRDIFYSNVNFFKSQIVVDDSISNICCLFQVPRYLLNILSSSKGFVGGDLCFSDSNGNQFTCGDTGIQIPNHVDIICNVTSKAKYILVVEKEATYTRIIESKFYLKVGPCIIITGKGFPDINTRFLLKKLHEELQIPVFALVDSDPHGIEIMCVYKFGSKSLSYDASNLTCSSMKWIGILPKDIDFLEINEKVLIPMSDFDKKKCRDLLKRPYFKRHDYLMEQVNLLLKLGKKAEIECLDSISHSFMTDIYLPQKIRNGDWL